MNKLFNAVTKDVILIKCPNCKSKRIDINFSKYPYIEKCKCRNCKKDFRP